MSKEITILGSTGSIGTQTLDVCRSQGFKVKAITGCRNLKLLEKQAREFLPEFVVVADNGGLSQLKVAVADLPVKVLGGKEAIVEIASIKTDIVANSILGIAGLRPTLAALGAGNAVALSNKEALITGGKLVMDAAKHNNVDLLPVDSEHSAIWQSLRAGNRTELKKIFLTASGGPFFGRTREELEKVVKSEALAHPNWEMGQKITVDSATLMNKGLEFIEAMWLFNLRPDQIEIVVHRESVIHSAVEYVDGSVIAQMGTPDMRVAIQYALTYPQRLPIDVKPFSLTDYKALTFAPADTKTFVCLASCMKAGSLGGLAPTIVNGANEIAVELFLKDEISFTDIFDVVEKTANQLKLDLPVTLENIEAADNAAREYVLSKVN